MSFLADLLRQMASLGAARVRSALVDLALMLGIGLSLLVAAGFGLQALHGALRPLVGPVAASTLMAALMVILALALALCLSVRRNRGVRVVPVATPQPVPQPVPQPNPVPQATASDPVATADIGTSAAFLAGFLVARRML